MSRLDIKSPSRAQTVVDNLYRDVERRIAASPPGLCPVDMSLAFLHLCHAQSCGKCVPCRIGLGQLSKLIATVLDGTADMGTIDIIEKTARTTLNTADCAIGRDAARLVLDGLEGFREDAALSTWLYRLASNACIDLLRRSKRTVDGVSLDDEDVHLEVRDRAPTPEEHVEGRETQRRVREGLAALPEDYRRVLGLRELHQLSYAEICEVTELELGTVKSRINRARLLLRNYLAADGNFFEKPASKVTECNQTVGGERNAI